GSKWGAISTVALRIDISFRDSLSIARDDGSVPIREG
ncbi:hypothetical protein Tco_1039429, partial [Tanacetum coccineum]